MIPKIIHYCWFGRGEMDPTSKRCIDSWKKYCPDYKVVLWNEDNFDIEQNTFVKEAYKSRKWAFVSDYVRLYALYHFGGVYMDADVELLKNLDDLLNLGDVVTSYQECTIPAAVMLAKPQNPWIEKLLSYYDNRHFLHEDGTMELTQNDRIITVQSVKECGFRWGDSHIAFGNVCLLESAYFGPYQKKRRTATQAAVYKIDPNKTYAIHHGIGSWATDEATTYGKLRQAVLGYARYILPEKVYMQIKKRSVLKTLGIESSV